MKHEDILRRLKELKIESEYKPPNSIPVQVPLYTDHYRTFLGDSEVKSNVLGRDSGMFLGVKIYDDPE